MAVQVAKRRKSSMTTQGEETTLGLLVRIGILILFDAVAVWFFTQLVLDGVFTLAAAIAIVAIIVNVVLLLPRFYPIRWMLIGIVLMLLFVIYPILFTIYVAFTNYGDGHLLTKDQAITQIQRELYLPEGGASYTWTAYVNPEGTDFRLWLQDPAGNFVLARPGEDLIEENAAQAEGVGAIGDDGIPQTIDGYQRLNRLQVVRFINTLSTLTFGNEEQAVQVRTLDEAAALVPRYVYDAEQDAMIDQQTGRAYANVDGEFTFQGQVLRPGFRTVVGLENFQRFFASSAFAGPLVRIIIWNFAFALLSVLMTFALGLTIAYIYNDPEFPGKKIIQSFLLIPYTIPSLITILIWRGLMNPDLGIINRTVENLTGFSPPWFTDQWWAKAAILIVNLWLGYPYFMLICSGALQAIPKDLYQAAEVDGANAWQRFSRITLPLLLVSVGPLLVASFTFNFNNFNLIFLFIAGGPPIAGSPTRAGHTDILISYVYQLAFAGGRGVDYGLASAITIVIFVIVALITLAQFRYTQMWEEVGENV